jgi:hypothetical protein
MLKKINLAVILLLLLTVCSFAQLKEKDNLLGPSLGFWPSGSAPTFGANFESQLAQLGIGTISLGGVFRYTTFRNDFPFNNYWNYNFYTIGLQSNYNFNEIGDGRFVPFVGLVLGYNNVNASYVTYNGVVYSSGYSSGFWLWGQLGMRYFFSPRVAGSVRFGLGNFNFNTIDIGLDFKL